MNIENNKGHDMLKIIYWKLIQLTNVGVTLPPIKRKKSKKYGRYLQGIVGKNYECYPNSVRDLREEEEPWVSPTSNKDQG